jgi:putative ABC transport system ATP-binding protein
LGITNRRKTESGIETRRADGSMVRLGNVDKVYRTGRIEYQALRGVELRVNEGELVALVGPSGSGKSTILNLVSGIDKPTAGSVQVGGQRIDEMSEEELAAWRGAHVGIVFQFFQLLPILTAVENVALPLELAGSCKPREARAAAKRSLELVGLGDKLDHLPGELSGGEQQRVAIARALVRNPQLIVADEPTGNLDSSTADKVLELLMALNRDGTTVVFVTHDAEVAALAHRVISIRDGRIINGEPGR